jgi:protein-S-isoprenylcysteine O-methyltransferase Ste14
MTRALAVAYGILAYLVFLGTFIYAIGFVGNISVAKSIDSGVPGPFGQALLVNLLLLALFAIQHTIMARPAFKEWWTKIVPRPIERSTFVLITSLILVLLFWQWRPMPDVVWEVQNTVGVLILQVLFWLGWALVLASSFVIDHFDLFGLRQVSLYLKGKAYTHPGFKITAFYKFVRHPLLLGFVIAFWATPRMTVGHLVFAIMTTLYILVGIQFEERDLAEFHGEAFAEYQRSVPALVPFLKKKQSA